MLGSAHGFLNIMFIELVEFMASHTVTCLSKYCADHRRSQSFHGTGSGKGSPYSPVFGARLHWLFFSYYMTDQVFEAVVPTHQPVRLKRRKIFVEFSLWN